MNKTELVAAIADRTGVSKTDVDKSLGGLFDVVSDQVKAGDKVSIPGFISFEQTIRKPRTGRNPQTGESIQIKGGPAVKVSAGAKLKGIFK
ncbi:MAG: integration host factor [Actinomycetia bacterium]|nr:integration host factor [Actinomycetes bacterium]MCP3910142.1 integration host factor [Actinomycetes bacterium]MCP4085124.1 integration host factor [Actinomycetes bacterium]